MNPNDILSAINSLTQGVSNTPVANATIPTLDFKLPTDLDAKYKEFLDRASKDPDIIAYYKGLLDNAKGDTDLAKGFLERDYTMGVRKVTDNLSATLKQLGFNFRAEDETLANNLNQRGIAMTDTGDGQVAYAAGGQPGTELGRLKESQTLRQEAEQRTARQGIEGMGLKREQGQTQAGQALRNTALELGQKKSTDIFGRANINFGAFQANEIANANKALADQKNNQMASGGGGGSSGGAERSWINPKTGVWDDNYHATGNMG